MRNATIKRLIFLILIATLTGLAGCSSPEEKKTDQLEDALALSQQGRNAEALQILESLSVTYPNDIEILQSIGRIHAQNQDHTMAAFFLEQAHLLNPTDVELLYQTYQAMEATGQPSGEMLEKLAALSSDSMSDELWLSLGEHRMSNNQPESALTAFLKGVNPDQQKPAPETAAMIGQLFAELENYPQATKWLEIAADSNDPSALTALFGLLEIQLAQKQWVQAEATIARLDNQFMGAVEASKWQEANLELKRWRAAQDQMQSRLAAAEKAKEKAAAEEEAARKAREAEAAAQAAAALAQADTETTSEEAEIETGDPKSIEEETESSEAEDGSGKAQVIADLEAAEAMATQPAIEPDFSVDATLAAIEEDTRKSERAGFNPNITIEPADPDLSFSVNFDQERTSPQTSYSVDDSPRVVNPPIAQAAPATPKAPAAPTIAARPQIQTIAPIQPPRKPPTLEELLAEAETAEIDRDYKSAIRKYWAAISITNNRADVWNLLSRAYLIDGQLENADTAALEAVRLAPNEVAYTLDFLRVAQRSRPPEEFLSQLETAYDRFPANPEITLSLARAYERITNETRIARNLYQRFIDIAPNHPLVPEARSAVTRLR